LTSQSLGHPDSSGGYEQFPFVAEFYDYVVPYRDRKDANFYVEIAKELGGPVLELGCGTGRVLIPTAQAGIEIAGLDSSALMLGICKQKLSQLPEEVSQRIKLVEGDMRAFDLNRKFNLATIPFRPFQHLLTVGDQLACLSCLHRHLFDRGWLVMDLFNPSLSMLADPNYKQQTYQEPEFVTPDGRKVNRIARTISQNLAKQIREIEFVYEITHPDGRTEAHTAPFKLRYMFRFEVEHLLSLAGFSVEKLYSDFDRSPFGSKYPGELIFVARKR
jgi:SAM-dependent methyltransferase